MQDNFTKRNMVPMLNEMIQVRAKYLGIPPNLIKWIVFDRDQNADWLEMLRKSDDEVEFCTAIKNVIRQWEASDYMLVSAKRLGRKTWLDCVRTIQSYAATIQDIRVSERAPASYNWNDRLAEIKESVHNSAWREFNRDTPHWVDRMSVEVQSFGNRALEDDVPRVMSSSDYKRFTAYISHLWPHRVGSRLATVTVSKETIFNVDGRLIPSKPHGLDECTIHKFSGFGRAPLAWANHLKDQMRIASTRAREENWSSTEYHAIINELERDIEKVRKKIPVHIHYYHVINDSVCTEDEDGYEVPIEGTGITIRQAKSLYERRLKSAVLDQLAL
jgi:hypothetical protein|tara:strand:- start:11859 stop:12851 length:993 start_codon:yes stop_codon:yes gene_type:complete